MKKVISSLIGYCIFFAFVNCYEIFKILNGSDRLNVMDIVLAATFGIILILNRIKAQIVGIFAVYFVASIVMFLFWDIRLYFIIGKVLLIAIIIIVVLLMKDKVFEKKPSKKLGFEVIMLYLLIIICCVVTILFLINNVSGVGSK